MKICLVGPTKAPEDSSGEAFAALLKPSFDKVLRPDTQVIPKNLKTALRTDYPLDFAHPYFVFLDTRSIIEAFIEAENERFDAAWINFFADAGVNEARSVVSIPLVGPAESTMLLACQLGRKFGLVAPNMPGAISFLEEIVRLHRLEDRCSGMRMHKGPFLEVLMKGIENPNSVADVVAEAARELVADGADVIIVGCCGLAPICGMAGFNKITADGQDVPILNPTMVAAKTAEMLVDIKKGIGLPIPSRAGLRALPSKEDLRRVRSYFGLPT